MIYYVLPYRIIIILREKGIGGGGRAHFLRRPSFYPIALVKIWVSRTAVVVFLICAIILRDLHNEYIPIFLSTEITIDAVCLVHTRCEETRFELMEGFSYINSDGERELRRWRKAKSFFTFGYEYWLSRKAFFSVRLQARPLPIFMIAVHVCKKWSSEPHH